MWATSYTAPVVLAERQALAALLLPTLCSSVGRETSVQASERRWARRRPRAFLVETPHGTLVRETSVKRAPRVRARERLTGASAQAWTETRF